MTARALPEVVDAGGLRWTRAADGDPLGSPIGYELAVLHGTPVEPQTPALAAADSRAQFDKDAEMTS